MESEVIEQSEVNKHCSNIIPMKDYSKPMIHYDQSWKIGLKMQIVTLGGITWLSLGEFWFHLDIFLPWYQKQKDS